MDIKPIETYYNGYRFRSRLEARWAVFFDTMGIPFAYEPEGYKLSDGTYYLPDFFLPTFNIFAEVKPSRSLWNIKTNEFGYLQWDSSPGYKILERLCEDTHTGGILLEGAPLEGWYQMAICDSTDGSAGNYFNEPCATFATNAFNENVILINDTRDRAFCARGFGELNHVVGFPDFIPPYYLSAVRCMRIVLDWNHENDDLSAYLPYLAAIAARQARFEHGEKPNTGGVNK